MAETLGDCVYRGCPVRDAPCIGDVLDVTSSSRRTGSSRRSARYLTFNSRRAKIAHATVNTARVYSRFSLSTRKYSP